MNIPVFEEYKTLIGEAEAFFDIQDGVTKIDGAEYENFDEILTYNGYNTPRRFKAKLKSLSAWLEYEIEQTKIMVEAGLSANSVLLKHLAELEKRFIVNPDNTIYHSKFQLKQTSRTAKIHITQHHYQDFINNAYESIRHLNTSFQIEKEFHNLFIGDYPIRKKRIEIVDTALTDLGIVDAQKQCKLTIRRKAIIGAIIVFLIDKEIIAPISQRDSLRIFWRYLNGLGNPPEKINKASYSFPKAESIVKHYFEKKLD